MISDEKTFKIIGICMDIHNSITYGLSEKVYQEILELELTLQNIPFEREKTFKITEKGHILKQTYKADFIVYNNIVIELKSLGGINDEHIGQTLNYMGLIKGKIGLIINFGLPKLEYKRVIRR